MSMVFGAALLALSLAGIMFAGLVIVSQAALGFRSAIGDLAQRAKRREQEVHDNERRLAPPSTERKNEK